MDTLYLDVLVDKREIMFLNAIIESYEGIAFFRTIDQSIGHVLLMVPPDFISEVNALLESIMCNIDIKALNQEQALKDGFSFFINQTAV